MPWLSCLRCPVSVVLTRLSCSCCRVSQELIAKLITKLVTNVCYILENTPPPLGERGISAVVLGAQEYEKGEEKKEEM
jgi:hypothetical protein